MNLKNYTSGVDADFTVSRIERLLVSSGAEGIQKMYGADGSLVSLTFKMVMADSGNAAAVRLPANVGQCQEAFWQDYCKHSIRGRKVKE